MKKKFGCSWNAVVNMAISLGLKPPKSNQWTKEDVEKLKKYANIYSCEKIASELNRTPEAVYLKAKKLNIIILDSGRKWTSEEEEKLKKMWGNRKIENIAKELHRSVFALKVKATRMKLGPMILNNFDIILISDLSELFGVTEDMVRNSWINKGLKIKEVSVSKNKKYKGVTLEDLWKFLEENQSIWDSKKLEENILGEEPNWLKAKRISDRDKIYSTYTFWTEEEKEKARFWIQQGKSYEFISKKVNHSASAVEFFLHKEGYAYLLSKFWTTKDIKFVRENKDKLSTKEIAEKLRRRPKSVATMKSLLSYNIYEYKFHNWTEEENRFLIEKYRKIPNHEIANHIGVCREVLIEQLKLLGIYTTNYHQWIEEEDDYILANYKKISLKEMTDFLEVSHLTLIKRLKKLGIFEEKEFHEWTEEEDIYLKENYKKVTDQKLIEHFQVSRGYLIKHLEELGIYKKREFHKWTEEDDIYLKENYKKVTDQKLIEHFQVSRGYLIKHLEELEIYENKRKRIWTEEENEYLKQNYKKGMKTQLMKQYHIGEKKLCAHLETLGIDLNRKFSDKELLESRKVLLGFLKNLLEIKREPIENVKVFKK